MGKSYSQRQIALINHAVANNLSLMILQGSDEWRTAQREHDAFIVSQRSDFKAQHYLAHGNDGPFKSVAEREAAFAHPLYNTSEEYRMAVQHKVSQTPKSIMGLATPNDPLSPAALIQAAREDLYHAKRNELIDKSNSANKVEAAQAQLDILAFATDPQYAELRAEMERTEAETKPYETWLKQQPGGIQFQTFPQGTPEEMQAEADRRNVEAYIARPGGRGDGEAEGEPNTTWNHH